MSSSSIRSTPTRGKAKKAPAAALAQAVAAEPETRGARRRRETRTRLLEAALRLMADKGMEGVAINEITEAADVGFGSFYNHFASKEAIYEALIDTVFDEFGRALDAQFSEVQDPAIAIAGCVRHTLLRARREPLWGRFLLREGHSPEVLTRGLGLFLLRDLKRGIKSGRFVVPDLFLAFIAVGGTVLAAIPAEQQAGTDASPQAEGIKKLGMKIGNIPERTAAMALGMLGVPQREAVAISRLPLPAARD